MSAENRRLAAIMFTNIVGYSSLTQRDKELSQELLREHNKLLRPTFNNHAGKEIKTIGDSFHFEFPSTLQAARAAIEAHKVLAMEQSEKWLARPQYLDKEMLEDWDFAQRRNNPLGVTV